MIFAARCVCLRQRRRCRHAAAAIFAAASCRLSRFSLCRCCRQRHAADERVFITFSVSISPDAIFQRYHFISFSYLLACLITIRLSPVFNIFVMSILLLSFQVFTHLRYYAFIAGFSILAFTASRAAIRRCCRLSALRADAADLPLFRSIFCRDAAAQSTAPPCATSLMPQACAAAAAADAMRCYFSLPLRFDVRYLCRRATAFLRRAIFADSAARRR